MVRAIVSASVLLPVVIYTIEYICEPHIVAIDD
jgi:hypothetical protein